LLQSSPSRRQPSPHNLASPSNSLPWHGHVATPFEARQSPVRPGSHMVPNLRTTPHSPRGGATHGAHTKQRLDERRDAIQVAMLTRRCRHHEVVGACRATNCEKDVSGEFAAVLIQTLEKMAEEKQSSQREIANLKVALMEQQVHVGVKCVHTWRAALAPGLACVCMRLLRAAKSRSSREEGPEADVWYEKTSWTNHKSRGRVETTAAPRSSGSIMRLCGMESTHATIVPCQNLGMSLSSCRAACFLLYCSYEAHSKKVYIIWRHGMRNRRSYCLPDVNTLRTSTTTAQ